MKVSPDLIFHEKGFIFDPNTGATYSLNTSGAFIFQQLQNGVTGAELVQRVVDTFDVDTKTARRDVEDIIQQFISLGLVTTGD